MKQGFIIGDGTYAAIPFGKKLMIIHNGQQMDVVNTEKQARTWIQQHKKMNPKPRAPRKPRAAPKSQKNQESTPVQEQKTDSSPKKSKKIPNGNTVPVKKPSTRRKKAP